MWARLDQIRVTGTLAGGDRKPLRVWRLTLAAIAAVSALPAFPGEWDGRNTPKTGTRRKLIQNSSDGPDQPKRTSFPVKLEW